MPFLPSYLHQGESVEILNRVAIEVAANNTALLLTVTKFCNHFDLMDPSVTRHPMG